MDETQSRKAIHKGDELRRSFRELSPALVDREKRTVTVSFSSEEPVERYYDGKFIDEVLDHGDGGADFGRLNSKGPILMDHDPEKQIGVNLGARIEEDESGRRVGRLDMKITRNPEGDALLNDLEDGIRGATSVGYEILGETKREERDEGRDAVFFRFSPLEVSFVAIPADITVGAGRGQESEVEIAPKSKASIKMPEEEKAKVEVINEPTPEQKERLQADAATNERDRAKAILLFASSFESYAGVRSIAEKAISEGTELNDAKALIIKSAEATPEKFEQVRLTEKEKKVYSLTGAINRFLDKREIDGLEREVSDHIAELTGRPARGFYMADSRDLIPDAIRTDMDVATAATAGDLVGEDHLGGQFISYLRPDSLLSQLGVTRLTGLTGNVAVPRQTAGSSLSWKDESSATPNTNLTVDDIELAPNEAAGYQSYTRKLLAQSNPSIDALVRNDLGEAINVVLTDAVLEGTGTKMPNGIFANASSSSSIASAGAPTWTEVVEFETDLATSDALNGNISWVTTPAVRGAMKTTRVDSGSGIFITDSSNMANGYPVRTWSALTAARIIFGNFSDYMLATWGGVDLFPDEYSDALNRKVRIHACIMADGNVRRGASFSVSA